MNCVSANSNRYIEEFTFSLFEDSLYVFVKCLYFENNNKIFVIVR